MDSGKVKVDVKQERVALGLPEGWNAKKGEKGWMIRATWKSGLNGSMLGE